MGVLYEMRMKVDKTIQDKNLDASGVRGKIALHAGFLLSLVTPTTPDDPVKIDKLRKAAEIVMQIKL